MGRGRNTGAETYWNIYSNLLGETKEAALALHLGISTSTISSWKNGGRFPPVNIAIQIAEYFGVSVERFFPEIDEKSHKENRFLLQLALKYRKFLEDFDCLDEQTRKVVGEMLHLKASTLQDEQKKRQA